MRLALSLCQAAARMHDVQHLRPATFLGVLPRQLNVRWAQPAKWLLSYLAQARGRGGLPQRGQDGG